MKIARFFLKCLVIIATLSVCSYAWSLDAPNITATPYGPNQINLTWPAVSNPGYGYRVEIQSTADTRYTNFTDITLTRNELPYLPYWVTEPQYTDPTTATSGPGDACQFPVFGLMNNTAYSFRVRTYALNDSGMALFSNSYSNTASATTANYTVRYVSTSGNDSNNGQSPSTAWKTIAYAGSTATAGQVVYILGGTYVNDHIKPTNSGFQP